MPKQNPDPMVMMENAFSKAIFDFIMTLARQYSSLMSPQEALARAITFLRDMADKIEADALKINSTQEQGSTDQ